MLVDRHAERLALVHVAHRRVVRGARDADGARRDVDAAELERAEDVVQPLAEPGLATEHVRGRDAVVAVGHLDRLEALVPELADAPARPRSHRSDGPGSFSTMKHVMPSGVLAASATSSARSPLVTHIFVPLTMYSSPSGTALQRMACVSLPASGSLSENAARRSPVAIFGSHRACCSSVPNR